VIKIWGRKDSSNVQKVLWCCGELNLPYDRVDLGGSFGGNRESAYLALNPNGLVPTIQDGDFVLWESNSIVRYLVDKYGKGRLLPSTAEGRANAGRWMDWQLTTMNPAIVPLYWGLIRTAEQSRDRAAIEKALEKTNQSWQILEHHLADTETDYLAGSELTIGDIPLGIWAYRWFNLPIERRELPCINRWYGRLCERGPYRSHVMIPLS
jgi:glutathione S-transferase